MRFTHRLCVSISVSVALTLGVVVSGSALAGGRPISLTISGAAEAPGPADPDGSGTASFTFNPGLGQVCYDFTVTGVAPLTAAHIHIGICRSVSPHEQSRPPRGINLSRTSDTNVARESGGEGRRGRARSHIQAPAPCVSSDRTFLGSEAPWLPSPRGLEPCAATLGG